MRSAFGLVLGVTVALGMGGGTHAVQQQLEAGKAQDLLPHRDLYTPEEIQKNFQAQQFTPFGDQKLYFEILVPNGWESHLSDVDPDQVAHDNESPVQIADFEPGGVDDVGIQVLYMRVPEQTSLESFLTDYIKKSGGTLIARQQAESKAGPAEDALLRVNSEDLGPMLTRVTAIRRGEIVFAISGGAVEAKYEKYKRIFGAVAMNFQSSGK